MACGFVYVLTNRAMPGLVKIGFSTRSPEERAVELSTTGVPFPFQVAYSASVDYPAEAEAAIHAALDKRRASSEREFFRVSVEDAVRVIEEACLLGENPLSSTLNPLSQSSNANSSYQREAQKYYPKNVRFTVAPETQVWQPSKNVHITQKGIVECPHCAHRSELAVSRDLGYLPPLTVQCEACHRTIFMDQ